MKQTEQTATAQHPAREVRYKPMLYRPQASETLSVLNAYVW